MRYCEGKACAGEDILVMMRTRMKELFRTLGILGSVRFLLRFSSPAEWREILIHLRFYLYNHLVTHVPNSMLRRIYLRSVLGFRIDKSAFIHMGSFFSGRISIGRNSVIGRKCTLLGEITIGDNVSITAETYIFTSSHDVNSPSFDCHYRPVTLKNRSWTGARAMIMPGVTLGEGAVLGAMSVATKTIPDFSIFVGAPAKEIGKRNPDIHYEIRYDPYFN